MDENKTIQENILDIYDIPIQAPFMILGDINSDVYGRILMHKNEMVNSLVSWNNDDYYYGKCLNYNPNLKGEYYQYSCFYHSEQRMYGYENSLGFFKKNYYGELFDGLFYPYEFVRSKVSKLKCRKYIGDWHKDEDQREVVKVVIPLTGNNSYLFQIEGRKPFHIPLGCALAFDSSVPHRIICNSDNDVDRLCLVFSVSVLWNVDENGVSFMGDSRESIINQFLEKTNFFSG